jgi:hypothetical protein
MASTRPTGERLVFVGGVPRSGTTLVQHILDCHPQVFGGPEFDCIPSLIHAWRTVVSAHDRGRILVFCTREQIDAAFAHLIEELLLPVADAHGAKLLSEKTPFNVGVFTDLLGLLPRCRAIHVVRDPRAVVSSMLRVGIRCREKNEPFPSFVENARSAVQFTMDNLRAGFDAEKLFPQRVLTVKYESLVTQPNATVRQICSFLGISFQSEMLEPQAVRHPGTEEVLAIDNGTWLDPALGLRAIEGSRVTVWQDELGVVDSGLVTAAFRDHAELRALGYRFE